MGLVLHGEVRFDLEANTVGTRVDRLGDFREWGPGRLQGTVRKHTKTLERNPNRKIKRKRLKRQEEDTHSLEGSEQISKQD